MLEFSGKDVLREVAPGDRLVLAVVWMGAGQMPTPVAVGRTDEEVAEHYDAWLRATPRYPVKALYVAVDPVGQA